MLYENQDKIISTSNFILNVNTLIGCLYFYIIPFIWQMDLNQCGQDTVEERLQQVQARKQRMITGALTDEEVRSARIEELKMLFRWKPKSHSGF